MIKNYQGLESDYIYVKYITKNGRKIYPKRAKALRFPRKKSAQIQTYREQQDAPYLIILQT